MPDGNGDQTYPRGQHAQLAAGTQSPGMNASGPGYGRGGSRPPRKLLPPAEASSLLIGNTFFVHVHTSLDCPQWSPLNFPLLLPIPSSIPFWPSVPFTPCHLSSLIENLQHARLSFHTHSLLLPTQALDSLGERALVYAASVSPRAPMSHLELNG